MSNSIIIVCSVGIIQCILFGLLIFLKNNKRPSDWILLLWFIVFSTHFLFILKIDNDPDSIILILAKTFGLLHGPFLYIYTQIVFSSKVSGKAIIHLIPFLIFALISLNIGERFNTQWESILLISKTTSLLAYPIYVHIWLKNKLKFLKTSRADNFYLDSQWINTLTLLFLIYTFVSLLHVLGDILFEIQFSIILDVIMFVSMVTTIGFYGLKFRIVYEPDQIPIHPTLEKKRYKNSPLKQEEIIEKKKKIDQFFENPENYLDPGFSLSKLSEELKIPRHHLSEIINFDMGTTFYDLVNAKRIRYAVLRISNGLEPHITLEGLGYECGFKTKSAFYHHFKKHTGKTPGKFKLEISMD